MDESPRVFISYSHDSDTHRQQVLALSERLRAHGVETFLDQYVNATPAEVYNCWSLFERLADPDQHTEAMSSRPLLLHTPARLTRHGSQTRISISHPHAEAGWVQKACRSIAELFKTLHKTAAQ